MSKFNTRSCMAGASPRGITITEALISIGATTVLVATGTTVLANRDRGIDSARKLAELAVANECYAADFAGRQWTAIPDNVGAFGDNCASYIASNGSTNATAPSLILGWGANNALWGLFIGGSFGCGNWKAIRPMNFTDADKANGSWRLPNVWGFREYISRNFYSPEWYAEDDPNFPIVAAQFGSSFEFPGALSGGVNLWGGVATSSYGFSPAAMLNPGVLRARADGGYQSPDSFADSYRAPAVAQCAYPSLKTRMCESGWFREAPSIGLAFNAGAASTPFALFFDGSVQSVSMAQAIADDAVVREGTKSGDGLWSDDTPLGPNGWQLSPTVDGSATSFHMLTTGGILGRDLLSRE